MDKVTRVYEAQCLRLFDEDAYLQEFDAVVTACERIGENQVRVALDRTAFFPEGGGQDADGGTLRWPDGAAYAVTDVQEQEGQIWHTLALPGADQTAQNIRFTLKPGVQVHGALDWKARFDRMQNHSGEHIVSGLIHRKYGYENVGFHMGSDVITIDLSGPLSMEQCSQIEQEANEIIWADAKTQIQVYTAEEIRQIEYRSKKELIGDVRIVSFPGADVCACCGTHVSSAGQIGLIKLLSVEPFRGGSRVEMLSGRRAFAYMTTVWKQNHEISVALKAKPVETAAAVLRLKQQAADSAFSLTALQEKNIRTRAQELAQKGDVVLFEDALSAELVRKMCDAVMHTCGGRCLVLSGSDATGYKYCIGQEGADLRNFVREMNAALNGRGGGRPGFAQGSVAAHRDAIEDWLMNQ